MKMTTAMIALCLAAAGGLAAHADAQTLPYRVVALSGDPAPGTSGGVFWRFTSVNNLPVVNAAGQVAFLARPTVGFFEGIWSEGGGSGLALVAGQLDPAPGTPAGVAYAGFNSFFLDAAGQAAFVASLTGPGVDTTNDSGIWSEGGGTGLALLAREGDAAPGTPAGVVYAELPIRDIAVNAAGQAAFVASLTGPGVDTTNDSGIWSEGGGTGLALLARKGDAAPGMAAGVDFGSFSRDGRSLVLNGAGQAAFGVPVNSDEIPASERGTLWSEGGGSGLALLARSGTAGPGGVDFDALEGVVLNAAGQAAFWSGPNSSVPGHRIWSEGSGSGLAVVARTGDPAPGTPAGVVFDLLSTRPLLNDAGQAVFSGTLTGPAVDATNDTGIWSEGGGSGLALIAREGDPAPGTPPGVVFGGLNVFNDPPVLNAAGQVAFKRPVTGPGVNSSNNRGIWATDSDGELTLVVREGDAWDVDPEPGIVDARIVSDLFLTNNSGGGEGRPTSLNDDGLLVILLKFSDTTQGIFVVDLSAPEACAGDIADDFGTLGADGMISFGDFLALLGLIGPCPGGTPGCTGDIADDFGTLNGGDGMVSFGDFLALLGLIGPCP